MSADKILLYNYFRSSASYRVRLALDYKGLDYTYVPVHLVQNGGEQNQSDYTKLNPMRQVPTLVHNNFTLSQSLPIFEYLDEIFYNHPKLFPKDIKQKAQVREFCEIINSGIQPLQNLIVLQQIDSFFSPLGTLKEAWVHFWLKRGFSALEERLATTAGSYCFGNQISAADLFLMPQVFSALRFNFEIRDYSNIQRIYHSLNELSVLKKSHPNEQPDSLA